MIQVVNAAGKVELLVYGEIGGSLLAESVLVKDIARQIQDAGRVNQIDVRINSPGGSVFEGLAIFNYLIGHPARKVVHIDGSALSMGSVVAMSGDEIRMASNGIMMVHNPLISVRNASSEELRRAAGLVDTMRDQLAAIYAARAGQPLDKVLELMAAETWMDANEAKELGFCDVISGEVAAPTNFDPVAFANCPVRLRSKITYMAASESQPLCEAVTKAFNAIVDQEQLSGKSRTEAVRAVIRQKPEIYREYLKAANVGRPKAPIHKR